MCFDLNIGLIEKQERDRMQSQAKVLEAISILKSNGEKVTRKRLLELSGLSSGTLSKPHVKKILEEQQVLMYETKKQVTEEKASVTKSLKKRNDQLEKEIQKLKRIINDKDMELEKLKNKTNNTEEALMELRGKYQALLEYIKRTGIDDDTLAKIFKY